MRSDGDRDAWRPKGVVLQHSISPSSLAESYWARGDYSTLLNRYWVDPLSFPNVDEAVTPAGVGLSAFVCADNPAMSH
jgi:hypothetical protein